jgi:hypothetical protein
MSVEQIAEQIRRLPPSDLARLTNLFGGFLADCVRSADPDWEESPDQIAELDKRLAQFRADPTIAVPFEPDYFDNLRRKLADERAQKASAG